MSDKFGMPMIDVRTDTEIKADLRNQVKQLTADRDQWRKDCHTYSDAMRKREDQLAILRAERDALKSLLGELVGEDAEGFNHLMGTDWIDRVQVAIKGEL